MTPLSRVLCLLLLDAVLLVVFESPFPAYRLTSFFLSVLPALPASGYRPRNQLSITCRTALLAKPQVKRRCSHRHCHHQSSFLRLIVQVASILVQVDHLGEREADKDVPAHQLRNKWLLADKVGHTARPQAQRLTDSTNKRSSDANTKK